MSHGYLRNPASFGWQPPHKAATGGRLRFHAVGCRADGGTGLPPGTCQKCKSDAADEYRELLKRIDKRARAA